MQTERKNIQTDVKSTQLAPHIRPADIERTSMQIIEQELTDLGIVLSAETAPVVMRAIHTTADFDYAQNLVFTPDAVQRGIEALRRGTTVVTDTNMALAGVSKPGLAKLSSEAVCYMADPEVAQEAKQRGVTRAVISAARAAQAHPGCIYAVGNAPTALFEIARQMELGFRPALVVGAPVGFVHVAEAKEQIWECCRRLGIPAIIARGRKGGSSVAAAILNALIYSATDQLDPENRTWQKL
ncbi:MAG: precorrin-8X methylmutase [Lachnospiraceae bacterium]|nr:precorrin-8X methylmutase [Lachnospiraceae bacterium]